MRILFPRAHDPQTRFLETLPSLGAMVRFFLVTGVVAVILLATDAPELIRREALNLFDPGHETRQQIVEWPRTATPTNTVLSRTSAP